MSKVQKIFRDKTTLTKHVQIKHLVFFGSYLEISTFQIYFTNGKGKKYFIKRNNKDKIEEAFKSLTKKII